MHSFPQLQHLNYIIVLLLAHESVMLTCFIRYCRVHLLRKESLVLFNLYSHSFCNTLPYGSPICFASTTIHHYVRFNCICLLLRITLIRVVASSLRYHVLGKVKSSAMLNNYSAV